ncbi:helix-turn-helix domain-containing protein [Ditylenchus destructor]|uniref:Helix-turn-helix domain-containing protein n=1 Tax=Ditylenchus destructor TaxID=166010 RepID=A0AAD4QVJ1_9BILA|nr:helix-turn-helix domain-containing protein [Ditylenchus destructor]
MPAASGPGDWPDLLAATLARDPALSITAWADRAGLDPASVSRGFARAYGVSPKRFRLELRTRSAVRALAGWRGTLAAHRCGSWLRRSGAFRPRRAGADRIDAVATQGGGLGKVRSSRGLVP